MDFWVSLKANFAGRNTQTTRFCFVHSKIWSMTSWESRNFQNWNQIWSYIIYIYHILHEFWILPSWNFQAQRPEVPSWSRLWWPWGRWKVESPWCLGCETRFLFVFFLTTPWELDNLLLTTEKFRIHIFDGMSACSFFFCALKWRTVERHETFLEAFLGLKVYKTFFFFFFYQVAKGSAPQRQVIQNGICREIWLHSPQNGWCPVLPIKFAGWWLKCQCTSPVMNTSTCWKRHLQQSSANLHDVSNNNWPPNTKKTLWTCRLFKRMATIKGFLPVLGALWCRCAGTVAGTVIVEQCCNGYKNNGWTWLDKTGLNLLNGLTISSTIYRFKLQSVG